MTEEWRGDGFCRKCNAEVTDPVWRPRGYCDASCRSIDDITACWECDLDMGEHDEETRAAHQALTDRGAELWNQRVEQYIARGQRIDAREAEEWAERRKHLRVVSEP